MSSQTNFRLRPYTSFETNHLTYASTWVSDTVRVRLLYDTYIPSLSTHDYLDDVTAYAMTGVQSLSNKTALTTTGPPAYTTYSADATLMSGEGLSLKYLVIYKHTGVDSTSPLYFLGQLDSPIDLFGGAGGFVAFNWNLNGGIFRVTT